MRLSIVIFVFITALIVMAAHAGLLVSIIQFFHIAPGQFRKILTVIFIALSLSFIVSMLLIHWYEALLTRMFYLAASVWLGMFLYLLLATALCWIVVGISKLTGSSLNTAVMTAPIYLFAIALSLYGFWNAANPVLKQVTVKIENLPEQWKGRTVVQASDIHVGAINRAGFAQKIVNLINTAKPDA
ncbi:MAG: hypothetical protein WBP42_15270, partial [Candidatus Zixiibacteriota bacterium]